jgi:proline dehydrogenase
MALLRRGSSALLLLRAQQQQQQLLHRQPVVSLIGRAFASAAQPQQEQQQEQQRPAPAAAPSATPPPTATTTNTDTAAPLPRLDDPTAAFATRTTPELLRAWLVLRLCMFSPLVRNADSLLSLSRKLVGASLTDAVVRRTFFAHFCAGEDGDAIQPTIARLRAANVQSIVDYAAEDDVSGEEEEEEEKDGQQQERRQQAPAAPSSSSSSPATPTPATPTSSYVHPRGQAVVGRTYDYADEAACDAHVATFLSAIDAVGRERDGRGDGGFAAIKVTALGNPALLERMTAALRTVRKLFAAADVEGKGSVDLAAFSGLYRALFPHAPPDRAQRAFRELASRARRRVVAAADGSGAPSSSSSSSSLSYAPPLDRVDLVDWCLAIRLQDMPGIAERIARHRSGGGGGGEGGSGLAGEVEHAALDSEEVALADAMLARVAKLAERAAERRVRLMVDAEHSYFQPAIDHTAKQLMARYNGGNGGGGGAIIDGGGGGGGAQPVSSSSSSSALSQLPPPPPIVFNTYQCYLKDSRQRLEEDLELARRQGYRFAAKLVRGAYVVLERRRAQSLRYPSPVLDNIEQTHANYDACAELVLREVKERGAEVMLATHNVQSLQNAARRMRDLGIPRAGGGVFFGQLLGMSDAASFSLGAAGYQVAKYVPYGEVRLVIPYLIRRAQENSALLGPGVGGELRLLRRELRRRVLGF